MFHVDVDVAVSVVADEYVAAVVVAAPVVAAAGGDGDSIDQPGSCGARE